MKPARYLCVAADPGHRHIVNQVLQAIGEAGTPYRVVGRTENAALFVSAETQHCSSRDEECHLIGTVFGPDGRRIANPDDVIDDSATGGFDQLLERTWGSYTFIKLPKKGPVRVLRDPSATMPCYLVQPACGFALLGSHVRDMMLYTRVRPQIRWPIVARHLRFPQYRDAETALEGVMEVLPGWIVSLPSASLAPHWSPWRFVGRRGLLRDAAQAVDQLRETVLLAHKAWGTQISHALVALSGGLDSSIVCAGLAHAGVRCSAVTLSSGTATGDERQYANMVADALDVPLTARNLAEAAVDIEAPTAPYLPRPNGRLFWQSADRLLADTAHAVGADSHVHGGGGDNIFCYLQSVVPIVDRLLTRRYGWGTASTFRDVCELTETDAWTVARHTVRRLFSGRRHYRWSAADELLSSDAIAIGRCVFDHPWLDLPDKALPGSAAHIALLLAIQNYLEGFPRELTSPVLAPLLSQPIVELCLRIPTWMWCADGANRAVARRAFADLLPREILHRRSKGTPDGFSMIVFERNRPLIRSMLHDGLLARQGLIDLDALDTLLFRDGPVRGAAYSRALALCSAEAWARSWQ